MVKYFSVFLLTLIVLTLAFLPPTTHATSIPDKPPLATRALATASIQRFIGSFVLEQKVAAWCPQEQIYGARFTWVAIPWYAVEPTPSTFDWSAVDPIIQAARSCGMDIGVHILARSTWATLPPPTPGALGALVSMPPKNMNDYYTFVYQLASHYKGSVSRYSIENEAHATINWQSSPDSYFQMLATAYQAVHTADSNALVEDAGLSSCAFGTLVAYDMMQRGDSQGALDFWNGYFANFDSGLENVASIGNLQTLLSQPELQQTIQWASSLFNNSQYFDVQQIHYFAPWIYLSQVTDWIHAQLQAHGGDKPLDFWETGYGWDNVSTYDPQAHARDEVKIFATALGEGGIRVVQFEFNNDAASIGHPGLIDSTGTPRPVAQTYQILTQELNGANNPQRLNLGPSMWGYRFSTPTRAIYVVWSNTTSAIRLPITASSVKSFDISGAMTLVDPKNITITASPQIIEAPNTASFSLFLPLVSK